MDHNVIIEGAVKFREGKKWKARWCVLRKLSPVADSVQLSVWRDARAAAAGAAAGCKAALALAQFVGCEAGFTLDRHSHTLCVVCADLLALLAFESRERLMQWQARLAAALGGARSHLVLLAPGARAPPGPARLLLGATRAALTAGCPPRLLASWELRHLRRYGVVEGRFCLEGGSFAGAGEGPFVFVTDDAARIAAEFELAARGLLAAARRPGAKKEEGSGGPGPGSYRPDARLRELAARSPAPAEEARWGSEHGLGDTASVDESVLDGAGCAGDAGDAALQRCRSCMSKLGALSRSSTMALTPATQHFSPAWTMEALNEPAPAEPTVDGEPPRRPDRPPSARPERPPKPTHLDLRLDRQPPAAPCACPRAPRADDGGANTGPYENYDVPRLPRSEIGEYYDTPKRLKECLNTELFKIARNSSTDGMILKKPCGCLLRLGRRRPRRAPAPEPAPPAGCPCRRVTDWAHSWIRLPYCRRPAGDERDALYATVDLSRKTRRKTHPADPEEEARRVEVDRGPLAAYENLDFALSLEHYENARALLRRAGVTPAELAALGAALRAPCAAPGDYLVMEPQPKEPNEHCRSLPPGYTPMSPIGGFALGATARRARSPARLPPERSASNPALCASPGEGGGEPGERRTRSSSADSSRFLDDVKEFEGSRDSESSLETLREPVPAARGRAEGGAGAAPPGGAGGNRDSSSSNDSGVSSWSLRAPAEFELPPTTAAARRHYRAARRGAGARAPRRSRSSGAPRAPPAPAPVKSCSAEAEVPVLALIGPLKGVLDTHSTSSGASDMSDYIETLSICSSHSSTDTPITMRVARQTSTLRPRSGKEYGSVAPLYSTAP